MGDKLDYPVRKSNVKDRLSGLPLPLLHHVLSFLPTQHVVQTSVLSKNWRNIWCSVPYLDVVEYKKTRHGDVEDFVDCLLLQRDGSWGMKRFRLGKYIHGRSRINSWVIYALRHNVEVLDIASLNVELTHRIFSCESLREIKLSSTGAYSRISICLPTSICLPALRILHLSRIHVGNNCRLEELLFSVLPSLETLVIKGCRFEMVTTIFAPQLRILELKGSFPLNSLEISCPNLIFLKLRPYYEIQGIKFVESGLLHLNDANIQLSASSFQSTRQLFEILSNTRSLTLSSKFLSSVALELQSELFIQIQFCNLRRLHFRTTFSGVEFFAIHTILKHSPHIESLFMKNKEDKLYIREEDHDHEEYYSEEEEEDDHSMEEDDDHVEEANSKTTPEEHPSLEAEALRFKYKLSHLKLVDIKGFQGYKSEFELLKFFLENAPILENVDIKTSGNGNRQKLMDTCKKLMKSRRASSSVALFFS